MLFFWGIVFNRGIVSYLPVSLASVFGNRPFFIPAFYEKNQVAAIAIGVVNICIGLIYVSLAYRKKPG